MRRCLWMAVLAWPCVAWASEPMLHGGFSTGGGWDSNVASAGLPAAAAGDGRTRLWSSLALDLSDDDEVALDLSYDATLVPSWRELDDHLVSASASWLRLLGDRTSLRLALTGNGRIRGDPARSGWGAGAAATVRVRPGHRLALRLGASVARRWTTDAAYGGLLARVRPAVEIDLWHGAYAVAGYAFDVGPQAAWAAATDGPDLASTPAAFPAHSIAHTASLDLVHVFPGRWFVQAGYAFSVQRSSAGRLDVHSLALESGWSF